MADEAAAATALERLLGRVPEAARVVEAAAFLAAQRQRLADEPRTAEPVVAARMPQRSGQAAVIDAAAATAPLATPAAGLPTLDFTIEACVLVGTLDAAKTVRTIAAQWTGGRSDPGWSLGLTGEQSAHGAGTLIMELSGGEGGAPYVLVPSGIMLAPRRPYYVAAAVRCGDARAAAVTFVVKDLADSDAPAVVKQVAGRFTGSHAAATAFTIGGRDAAPGRRAPWDGLLDDVRLSAAALDRADLLLEGGTPAALAGFWTFEESPGFLADASGRGRTLTRPGVAAPAVADVPRHEALVDLCHVLFNTSDFLYVD